MAEQKTFDVTRELVAAALAAAADVVEVIEAPPSRTTAARKRLAGALHRIADGLDPLDASPSSTIH